MATTYAHARIIVADNASTDDSLSFLSQHYPSVEQIILPHNYGFAKGYNEALKNVEADLFVLLNSDVEVEAAWLEPMVALMQGDPSLGALQPKVRAYHNKHLFEYAGAAGGWIDFLGYPFARGRMFEVLEEDRGQYNNAEEIFWATGAAMMVRSELYQKLGGFDDFFFAHMEEIDLCWRIHLAGYRIMACPASVVYHVGGGTLPRGNARKTFLNFRNNMIMLLKNLPAGEKGWIIPLRMMLDWVAALKSLAGGNAADAGAILRAHAAALRWWKDQKKGDRVVVLKKLSHLPGVYRGSIVWQHFVKKKRYFHELQDVEK